MARGVHRICLLLCCFVAGALGRPKPCALSVTPDDGFVRVMPGSDVTLVCSATCLGGLSRDQLVWKDPRGRKVPLMGGGRVQSVSYNRWSLSRLVVSRAVPEDSGVYTCEVQHNNRFLQYPAMLQVQDTRPDDLGPRRGDIFIVPEPQIVPIRPVRSVDTSRTFLRSHDDSLLTSSFQRGVIKGIDQEERDAEKSSEEDNEMGMILFENEKEQGQVTEKKEKVKMVVNDQEESKEENENQNKQKNELLELVEIMVMKDGEVSNEENENEEEDEQQNVEKKMAVKDKEESDEGNALLTRNEVKEGELIPKKRGVRRLRRQASMETTMNNQQQQESFTTESFNTPFGNAGYTTETSEELTHLDMNNAGESSRDDAFSGSMAGGEYTTETSGEMTNPAGEDFGLTSDNVNQGESPSVVTSSGSIMGDGHTAETSGELATSDNAELNTVDDSKFSTLLSARSSTAKSMMSSSPGVSQTSSTAGRTPFALPTTSPSTTTLKPSIVTSGSGAAAEDDAQDDDVDISDSDVKTGQTYGAGNSGETDFGRYGKLAFGLAMAFAFIVLYALLLVILVPRYRKRHKSLNLQRAPSGGANTNRKDSGGDGMVMGDRPHKPLAPMTSSTGLNGEYITAVDLENTASGGAEEEKGEEEKKKEKEEKETDSEEKDGDKKEEDNKGQESFVSSFLIGRLSSSKPTDADSPPTDVTNDVTEDNVFASDDVTTPQTEETLPSQPQATSESPDLILNAKAENKREEVDSLSGGGGCGDESLFAALKLSVCEDEESNKPTEV